MGPRVGSVFMKQSIAPRAMPSNAGALLALMYITKGRLK
jgi:hypothetical protein